MKAKVTIKCDQCDAKVGEVHCDTADMPNELQLKINKVILAHRKQCPYYRKEFLK